MHVTPRGIMMCHKRADRFVGVQGIMRSSAEPWSQFRATALACDELPCYKYWPGRASNDTDPTDDAYSDTVVVVQHPRWEPHL